MVENRAAVTPEALAVLGGGPIAYVRAFKGDQARGLFPQMPEVNPDLELWALLGADGTPIMLADSREAVVMNAHENDLETVSLH